VAAPFFIDVAWVAVLLTGTAAGVVDFAGAAITAALDVAFTTGFAEAVFFAAAGFVAARGVFTAGTVLEGTGFFATAAGVDLRADAFVAGAGAFFTAVARALVAGFAGDAALRAGAFAAGVACLAGGAAFAGVVFFTGTDATFLDAGAAFEVAGAFAVFAGGLAGFFAATAFGLTAFCATFGAGFAAALVALADAALVLRPFETGAARFAAGRDAGDALGVGALEVVRVAVARAMVSHPCTGSPERPRSWG